MRIDAGLLEQRSWDEALLEAAGVPIEDATFVSIGGGLGSFAVVDFLRIAGVASADIRVLSDLTMPYQTFAARAAASQMGADDRLRSDSSSTIHNIWGWPGYALTEALTERTLRPLWQVITEPFLAEYFTPRVRTVLAEVEREAARIRWSEMLVRARAQLLRRRAGGGYFVLSRRLGEGGGGGEGLPAAPALVAHRCQHVHLALGHPGARLLPELVAFRETHPDSPQVAHVYESHEHIYEALVRAPGRVVVRGSGIGASRILERLIEDRDHLGAGTEILHVFRRYVRRAKGPPWFRRPVGHGFSYQPFNFPRGAGGGQLRQRMLAMSDRERARLIPQIGGTTTAFRRHWERQLRRGRREKWYRVEEGELGELRRTAAGKLAFSLTSPPSPSSGAQPPRPFEADFLIDATGLEDAVERHGLIADLLVHSGAALNAFGRLAVEPSFEVPQLRSGAGRLYASGAATLGGALAPVDSFWGLMHAAMEITDDLADQGMCEFPGVLRSLTQWWRRMRGIPP